MNMKLLIAFVAFLIGSPTLALAQTTSHPEHPVVNWKLIHPNQANWQQFKQSVAIEIAALNREGASDLLEMNLSCLHKKKFGTDGEYVGNDDCSASMSRFLIKWCSSPASDLSDLCLLVVGFSPLDYLMQGSPSDSTAVRSARSQTMITQREFFDYVEDRLKSYYRRGR